MGIVKTFVDTVSRKERKPKERLSQIFQEVQNVPAQLPSDEEKRISKLLEYQILDTLPSPNFDDLTQLASLICKAPIVLISFVERERQWFKSRIGLDATETRRDSSFCAHAILDPSRVLVIPDTAADHRFRQNELVLGEPKIRFYAGAPLVTPDGYPLGTICAIDREPRQFDESQQKALQIISAQVVAQLEIHRQMRELLAAKEYAEFLCISSFENLLLSTVGAAAFEEFLIREHCSENLVFWKEAKNFSMLFSKASRDEINLTSLQMVEHFIREGSPKQINITSCTRKDILAAFEREDIHATLFEEAKKEIFSLMKRDSYQKFLSSQQYKELVATVREVGILRLQEN